MNREATIKALMSGETIIDGNGEPYSIFDVAGNMNILNMAVSAFNGDDDALIGARFKLLLAASIDTIIAEIEDTL